METRITPENKTSRGAFCLFVKLSETQGVKFYATAAYRDQAMKAQDAAHAVACGPAVYGKLDMDVLASWIQPKTWSYGPPVSKVYGYVTDIVEVRPLTRDEFVNLWRRLELHEMTSDDISSEFNTGLTLSGVPVRYDFDPVAN